MTRQSLVAPHKIASWQTTLAWGFLALPIQAVWAQPFAEAQTSSTGYANGTLAPVQACADLARLSRCIVVRCPKAHADAQRDHPRTP